VRLTVAEQQEIQTRGVQARIEPRPVGRIVGSACQAMSFGLQQHRVEDAFEL
jgi:hypothetical protein